MNYPTRIGVALTQLLNALLGGWPDESTSSRLWRLEMQGRDRFHLRHFVDGLFGLGHCEKAYQAEMLRRQQAPIFR